LQLNSAESGRLQIDNARKAPMIRRRNWDGSMGIAAALQQTVGELIGPQIGRLRAFKLTGDDITRQPKLRARRESLKRWTEACSISRG
jgi:hypothetical protein